MFKLEGVMITKAERKLIETRATVSITNQEKVIAVVWLIFYMTIIGITIATPMLSNSIAIASIL